MQLWVAQSREMMFIVWEIPLKKNAVTLSGGCVFKPGYEACLSQQSHLEADVFYLNIMSFPVTFYSYRAALFSLVICVSLPFVCPIHQVSDVEILLTMFQWMQVDTCLPIPSGRGTDATHMFGAREQRRTGALLQRSPAAVILNSYWNILV